MANGSRIFCSHFKTILHLFFNCHYAMFLWNTIHIGFNINNIVGIYKIFIGLLDGRYQIIVWSYWHGHLHCLCTLATQVWSMSTKNYMHEAYVGGHQRRTKGVDDSSKKNKRSWFLHNVHALESMAMQIFSSMDGWSSFNRVSQ